MYQEDLQVQKMKEIRGEDKPKRKAPKKKDYQLFDMKTKIKPKKYKKKGK